MLGIRTAAYRLAAALHRNRNRNRNRKAKFFARRILTIIVIQVPSFLEFEGHHREIEMILQEIYNIVEIEMILQEIYNIVQNVENLLDFDLEN